MQNVTRRQVMAGGGAALVLISSSPAISSATTIPDAPVAAAIEKYHGLEDKMPAATRAAEKVEFALRKTFKLPPSIRRDAVRVGKCDIACRLDGDKLRRDLDRIAKTYPPDDPVHAEFAQLFSDCVAHDRKCAIAVRSSDIERLRAKEQEALDAMDLALEQVSETPAQGLSGVIQKFKFADEQGDLSEAIIQGARGEPPPLSDRAKLFRSAMADLEAISDRLNQGLSKPFGEK